MVQFGELKVPPLIDNGKNENIESGTSSSVEIKEVKKNNLICVLICVLIFLGVLSRSMVSEYNRYDSWLSGYLALSVLFFVSLSVNVPDRNEILPMKKFARPLATLFCYVEFCFVAATISISAPVKLIPAMITNIITSVLLTYLCSHFRLFSYKPLENNDKYKRSRVIYKGCDGIKIRNSRSFSIVVENTGSEIIPFAGLSIERLTIATNGGNDRSFVKFKLPEIGEFNPGQTVTFVPETKKKNTLLSIVDIVGFCCFGIDSGELILTKLTKQKKIIAQMEEHFDFIGNSENTKEFDSVTEIVQTDEGTKTVEIK